MMWLAPPTYGTSDHPTVAATITAALRAASALFVLMITAFYSGELVWRERDRKLKEIVDSTAVPSWVDDDPEAIAIFLILLVVNIAAAADGRRLQLTEGARTLGLGPSLSWFIVPFALDMLRSPSSACSSRCSAPTST